MTILKIEAFLQLTPAKIDDVLNGLRLDADDVEESLKDLSK